MTKVNKKLEVAENLRKPTFKDIMHIIISILGITIATIETIDIRHILQINHTRIAVYNIMHCLIIILITYFAFSNKHKEIKAKNSIKELEQKNKNLLEINDDVKCFKHDFNNIMQAINGYIDLKDMNSLEKYFNSIIKDCHHINTVELLNYKATENPAIYSVLIDKYTMAREKNININIDICLNLNVFTEKVYSISRMLGILLDNAIEATNGVAEKIINIELRKEKNKNLIIIENTFLEKEIDVNKIFEKGYTSKRSNSGLGLWKIRKIIEKDESLNLITTIENKLFKQVIELSD